MAKWVKLAIAAAVAVPMLMTTAYAADDYSVVAVQPDNQRTESDNVGYVDVKAEPGSQQTLQFQLSNTSNKTIKIKMNAGTATTSDNGAINYATQDVKPTLTDGLVNKMGDYLKADQSEITLKPGQNTTATATLKAPAQQFEGRMAGGVSFVEENQNRSTQSTNSMKINATYEYDVAVLLSNNQRIAEGMLQMGGVKATQVNRHTIFAVNVKNPTSSFINALGMKTTVTGPDGVKFTRMQANMQMAPNTQFNWGVYTNGKALKTGDYRVVTDTYWSKDGERRFKFSGDKYTYHIQTEKTVHVTAKQAADLNKRDYDLQISSKLPLAYKVFIGILLVIAAAILWFVFFKKRNVTVQVIDLMTSRIVMKERTRASRVGKVTLTLPESVRLMNDKHATLTDDRTLVVKATQTYIEVEVATLEG